MDNSVCAHHEDILKLQQSDHAAMEGKVSKSTIKWLAAIFSMPIIAAILFAWAFMISADYRYGSIERASINAANIKLLEERAVYLRADIESFKSTIASDLSQIKGDIKEIAKELRSRNYDMGKQSGR